MTSGLLVDGRIVPIPGVAVIGPHDAAWATLSPGDGTARAGWPSQIILHKTLADDPERVVPGMGPLGRAQRTAESWASDPAHSGAQLVVGSEQIACLADLVRFEAWHANQANASSVGVEHCEEPGGIVHQAVLDNGVQLVRALAAALGIQLQYPSSYREGAPLRRFQDGGRTLTGIFGHRDVTSRRGRWDPGESIWSLLAARLGAEAFDFERNEDLEVWRGRQAELNLHGAGLVVDGVPGRKTRAALQAAGYRDGIWALGRIGA